MLSAKSRLTRFELARVIGARSLQVSLGAPVLVNVEHEQDPIAIARMEFDAGAVPMIILRVLPDHTTERVE